MFTRTQQDYLLALARNAIAAKLGGRSSPVSAQTDPVLQERRGAFVTLYRAGELRGCIGYIESPFGLTETIEEVAVRSATQDPRFPPVSAAELDDLDIEISVLSTPAEVSNVGDITIGVHGLIVESERRRGLLLPQVADERNWDRETFLRETCRKAGLPPLSWKNPGTKIFSFTAEIIRARHE
ncbi:MAG TPA: AmmeMemoRadiSam system protein A [Bacteroidota bacterium]|nr:AmmeMemoRadiSam system protein A [Bacteroidota bacterium]